MLFSKKTYFVISILWILLPCSSNAQLAQKAIPLKPSLLKELDKLGIFGKYRRLIEIEQQKGTFQDLVFTDVKVKVSEEVFMNVKLVLATLLGVLYIRISKGLELRTTYSPIYYSLVMTAYIISASLFYRFILDIHMNPSISAWTNSGILLIGKGKAGFYKKEDILGIKLIDEDSNFIFKRFFLRIFLKKEKKHVNLLVGKHVDKDVLKELCKQLSINFMEDLPTTTAVQDVEKKSVKRKGVQRESTDGEKPKPTQAVESVSVKGLTEKEEEAYFDEEIEEILEEIRAEGKFKEIKYAYPLQASFLKTSLVYLLSIAESFFILLKLCRPAKGSHEVFYIMRFIIASFQSIAVAEWVMYYIGKRIKKGWALLTDRGPLIITPGYERNVFFSTYDCVKVRGLSKNGPYIDKLFILDKKGSHCSCNSMKFSSFLAFQAFYCRLVRAIEQGTI
ncbi:MAG: hypothetical protein AAF335_01075 [Bacteroidota bacterium]